jgi:hypothetical protein
VLVAALMPGHDGGLLYVALQRNAFGQLTCTFEIGGCALIVDMDAFHDRYSSNVAASHSLNQCRFIFL